MKALGLESITEDLSTDGYFVKCIVTETLAVFFPGALQHRDVKRPDVSYEDDYGGNAIAATITPGRIDARYHQAYSDDAVGKIFMELFQLPEMQWAMRFIVRYQGRQLLP